ncbi:MAG: radical SAM family heme chaperone HemW [Alphaproteobacteria bacterium]|nr:radical SAM family heme chaperone HemW [Alphaproteobacteria bacterium]
MSSQPSDPPVSEMFGVYIHWPYCLSKCPYCDFASTAGARVDEGILAKRYVQELAELPRRRITSVFFGGGTPSLMSAGLVGALLERLAPDCAPDVEITMEANPDAIGLPKMRALRDAGVNRLSLGVQALDDAALKRLGRRHSAATAMRQAENALRTFGRVNLDLIYARPGQTPAEWEAELKRALALEAPHYALYQLTIEEGTPFGRRGVRPAPDEVARDLYLMTDEIMAGAGLPAYEVSNYAAPGGACRHNMTYWLGADYAGVGPAACGRLGLLATQNPAGVSDWLAGVSEKTPLMPAERDMEKILMGLRLRRAGYPAAGLNPAGVDRAVRNRWLTLHRHRAYPTAEGILMLNRLILEVLPDSPAR